MTRPSTRSLVVVLLCVAVFVAACSNSSSPDGDDQTSSGSDTTASPTTAAPIKPPVVASEGEVFAVSPWFVSGETIAQGQARFAVGAEVMASGLAELMAGPNETDRLSGLTTGIVPRAAVRSLSLDGDTAVVDFTRPFETADTQPQVAQVVWTLTEFAGVERVKFLIDGEDNGATGTRPLTRADTRLQPAG